MTPEYLTLKNYFYHANDNDGDDDDGDDDDYIVDPEVLVHSSYRGGNHDCSNSIGWQQTLLQTWFRKLRSFQIILSK